MFVHMTLLMYLGVFAMQVCMLSVHFVYIHLCGMRIYKYVYTHTSMSTYAYTYMCMCMNFYACRYVCVCIYIYTYMCVCMYMYLSMSMPMYKYMYRMKITDGCMLSCYKVLRQPRGATPWGRRMQGMWLQRCVCVWVCGLASVYAPAVSPLKGFENEAQVLARSSQWSSLKPKLFQGEPPDPDFGRGNALGQVPLNEAR